MAVMVLALGCNGHATAKLSSRRALFLYVAAWAVALWTTGVLGGGDSEVTWLGWAIVFLLTIVVGSVSALLGSAVGRNDSEVEPR